MIATGRLLAVAVLLTYAGLAACGERRPPESVSKAPPPEAPAMTHPTPHPEESTNPDEAFHLSDEAWRARLTPEQYAVTRRKGTERAFTGRYWDTQTPGIYRCVCCGLVLFSSDEKFDAGCGWPSFTAPVEGAAVEESIDTSHGMVRTEVTCRRCGAHLGHVFDDGPGPTGQRYCINSVSLDLVEREASDAASDERTDTAAGDERSVK